MVQGTEDVVLDLSLAKVFPSEKLTKSSTYSPQMDKLTEGGALPSYFPYMESVADTISAPSGTSTFVNRRPLKK